VGAAIAVRGSLEGAEAGVSRGLVRPLPLLQGFFR
jgi:hypothetical protein